MQRANFSLILLLLIRLDFNHSSRHNFSVFAIDHHAEAGDQESIDLVHHEETNEAPNDQDETQSIEMEEESSEDEDEDEDEDEVDVIPMSSLDDISNLLLDPMNGSEVQSPMLQKYLGFDPHVTFVLTLVYSAKCPASQERFDQFTQEIPQLWKEKQKDNSVSDESSIPPPVLILLSVDEHNPEDHLADHIESFGITHIPALIWMVRDSIENTFVLDFMAAESPQNLTATEVLQSFQHLQSRLLWLTSSTMFDNESGVFHLKPRLFSATKQQNPNNETHPASSPLESWILTHGTQVYQSTVPTSFSALSETEYKFMQRLWYGEGQNAHDGFLLIGQCRTGNVKANSLLVKTFDRLTSMWINRRDIIMVAINDCPNAEYDHGKVYIWRIQEAFSGESLDISWEAAEKEIFIDFSKDEAPENLKNALVGATTPSVLWLDRQISAAIAFPTWRKVHAVLVVDLHRAWTEGTLTSVDERQAEALKRFRRFCRENQRKPKSEDVVCLVVPSTDVRTLTIFGIDVWTPMDMAAWQPENHSDPEILPVVFITDQRFGGTRRYYAHRDEINSDDAFSNFWMKFWNGALEPHQKSSPRSRTNKSGIRIVTAADFENEVLRQLPVPANDVLKESVERKRGIGKHALVMFTSKSCGHCRRLMALSNQVGRLFQKLGWSSFVSLYQLDVSTDEVIKSEAWNHTIRWVPDLLYVSLDDNRVVRYSEKDNYGDHVVGGVKSHMDLVEWFLHVADIERSQILQLLGDVRDILQEDERTTEKV